MKRKKIQGLIALWLFLTAAVFGIYRTGKKEKLPYYNEMTEAADKMRECTDLLKEERLRRGIPLDPEDYLQIGLIGYTSTAITTTVGAPEAKRTSELPDMAALCVRLLHEAGIKSGDHIGACYSGSFPGLNLALICAADVMKVDITYTAAIGASSYGANVPQFTSPEMLIYLYEKGMISAPPAGVTLGGDGDRGENMLGILMDEDIDLIEDALARIRLSGITPLSFENFEDDLEWHMRLYGDINGFVNIGGNVAGTGRDQKSYDLGQGIIKDAGYALTEKSGLMERYLRNGIPVVQLLNLKKLCAEYSLIYDPAEILQTGSSGVYYERTYSKAGILLTAAAGTLGLYVIFGKTGRRKKETDEPNQDTIKK